MHVRLPPPPLLYLSVRNKHCLPTCRRKNCYRCRDYLFFYSPLFFANLFFYLSLPFLLPSFFPSLNLLSYVAWKKQKEKTSRDSAPYANPPWPFLILGFVRRRLECCMVHLTLSHSSLLAKRGLILPVLGQPYCSQGSKGLPMFIISYFIE